MSWNLLVYFLPACNFFELLEATVLPKEIEGSPIDRSISITAIVKRTLEAEYVPGSLHFTNIQKALQSLPDSAEPKTIESFLQHRLKVLSFPADGFSNLVVRMSLAGGKYYIQHGADVDPDVLPWTITQRTSHILDGNLLNTAKLRVITSLATATLSVFAFGWPLIPSWIATVVAERAVETIYSHRAANAADDFAIKHCSTEELEKGALFLEKTKLARAADSFFKKLNNRLRLPSVDSRIAKIRTTIATRKEKAA